MTSEISNGTKAILDDVLKQIYQEAALTVSQQLKLPLPNHTKQLFGNPDDLLQKTLPLDTPEAEAERRRHVGERIKARRKQIGLTQAAVAKKLGIASQSVTNYESGKSDPSIRNLIALATVLDVSTDYLLGRSL